jgi:hypothetical protein
MWKRKGAETLIIYSSVSLSYKRRVSYRVVVKVLAYLFCSPNVVSFERLSFAGKSMVAVGL